MNNSYNYSFLITTENEEFQQHIAFEKKPPKQDSGNRNPTMIGTNSPSPSSDKRILEE